LPEGRHYAVFSPGASSWHNYTLGSCCDAAIHSYSSSVGWYYYFFRTFFATMAIPEPEIFWGLLAVDPDVAEPLATVARCEADLVSSCFYLYNDVGEVGEDEDLL
jgi:hypothetical protein